MSRRSSGPRPVLNTYVAKSAQNWHDCVLFRSRAKGDAAGMATLAQKIEAEARMRELLEESDLLQPDRVEYGFTCIRLFFNETKQVIVVDIDDPDDGEAALDTDAA